MQRRDNAASELNWRRLALRIGTCLIVLILIDVAVGSRFSSPSTASAWRMPRALPTSQLDVGTAAIEAPGDVIAFLGGSPAWGDAVESAASAVPARLESQLRHSGRPGVRVVNLACNGQLVGDSYVLAKYASEKGADLVIVQVTYHNFSPAGRDGKSARYPELSERLGVALDAETARALDRDPTPRPDVTGSAERWVRKRWALYGHRERMASAFLGASPEQLLHSRWNEAVNGFPTLESTADEDRSAFSEMDPGEQSMMADEWSRDTEFDVDESDSEVVMLRRLCEDLNAGGTPVLVYLAPLNLEALTGFSMLDEERFRRNVVGLKAIVERSGGTFVDLNEPAALPMDAFADINHTTVDGSELTALRLLDTAPLRDVVAR